MSNAKSIQDVNEEIKIVTKIYDDLSKLPSYVTREPNCLLAMTAKIIKSLGGFDDWGCYKVTYHDGTVEFKLFPHYLGVSYLFNSKGILANPWGIELCMPNYVFSYGLTAPLAKGYLEIANKIIDTYKKNSCLFKKKSL